MEQELHLYANSPEEVQSTKAAITQFSDAQNPLKAVQDNYGYRIAASTYSSKRLTNGVPIDLIIEYIYKNHKSSIFIASVFLLVLYI